MRETVAAFLRTPGGRAWWQQRKVWFSAFGQEAFERILTEPTITGSGAGPTLAA
jgi:hypothetical protein